MCGYVLCRAALRLQAAACKSASGQQTLIQYVGQGIQLSLASCSLWFLAYSQL